MTRLVRIALLVAASCSPAAHATAASYSIIDLGALGGTTSFARAVNQSGQVTGNAQTAVGTPSPRLNAYVTGPDGTPMTNIGTLPGSNNFSRGYAINDSGVVVGESDNNASKAFRYDSATGTLTNLGGLTGPSGGGVAHGINNSGVIVGASSNGQARRAFYHDGTMQDLGTLAGTTTSTARAWSINESGTVVGLSQRADGVTHATLWEGGPGGTIRDLGSLVSDSFYSQALDINDAGLVVGSSIVGTVSPTSSTPLYQAFLWSDGGGLIGLGGLDSQPTFIHSEAKAINNAGFIVGGVSRLYGSPTFGGAAVLWDQSGQILDLNTLIDPASGWNLLSAEGINDRGQIVGYGSLNGQTRAFLLNYSAAAVPEPASIAMLAAGLAGLGLIARRRAAR